ncbi:MAG: hypothetical protein V1797_17150 [Pseudomonadota bacterium]
MVIEDAAAGIAKGTVSGFLQGARGETDQKTIRLIKDAVCYNQGEFIQYSIMASLFHRALKYLLANEPHNLSEISEAKRALEGYLSRNIKIITVNNFKYLEQYYSFSRRCGHEVRICIKVPFEDSLRDDNLVVEAFRGKEVGYYSRYPISQNTGFRYVKENGKYYLCNNIPEEAKRGNYKNPRLKVDRVLNDYKPPSKFKAWGMKRTQGCVSDPAWVRCWRGASPQEDMDERVDPPPDSCYKSTLIVPMTLKGHDSILLDEFKAHMDLRPDSRNIFGFLCFDHVGVNFFNNDSDISVGYIIADILSLYYMTRLNYTKRSDSFMRAEALLNQSVVAEAERQTLPHEEVRHVGQIQG